MGTPKQLSLYAVPSIPLIKPGDDIANIIAEKCVHPENKRPFSINSIKDGMKKIHVSVKEDKSAK